MKIETFFQKLTDDPYGRYACCAFRSIDGVIFVRQEAGLAVRVEGDPADFPIKVRLDADGLYYAQEPFWALGAIVEEDVLMTHYIFDNHRTERMGYVHQRARQGWGGDMCSTRHRIKVRGGSGDTPILKPHTRKLRNRYGKIRDVLVSALQLGPRNRNHKDADKLMPVEEWWDWAWAWAITDCAKRVTDSNSKIASLLTSASFDNLTNIEDKLQAVREKVADSDFEAAKELFTPLNAQIDKLSDLTRRASSQISSAQEGLDVSALPDQFYRLHEDASQKERYLFTDKWYCPMEVHTKGGQSLLEAFDSLSDLFAMIGLLIKAPYGVQVCPENISQLAVLNESVKEVILSLPDNGGEVETNEPKQLLA